MSATAPASSRRRIPESDSLPKDYFRIRDFEYVQPLYDLAFLLEVSSLAKGAEIPKYRTFSLWRAGYSMDGYGTTIDRWLNGSARDEDLDYVPSSRIRQYLEAVRKTGTLPELRDFKGNAYARCLRLRSVRGLGPSQIALTVSKNSLSEEWFNQTAINLALSRDRIADLYAGDHPGPWQVAHVIPPLLRLLKAVDESYGQALRWSLRGVDDPFSPIKAPLSIAADASFSVLRSALDKALKKERLFRRDASKNWAGLQLKHQLGWSISADPVASSNNGETIFELAQKLDPLSRSEPTALTSDLHLHTAWSDGSASVNSMANAIVATGLKFFAVTDHSRSSKLQGGLTPVLWLRQANALTLASPVCPVLHGIEVDILKDGSLDLPSSLLEAADLVVASVHSSWSEDARENTNRLLRAIESGCVDILAHPTAAIVGKPGVPDYERPPAGVIWDEVFAACARWHVALEMNCFPSRLDLPLPLLQRAIDAGCPVSFGSDAHARSHLMHLRYGEVALQKLRAPTVLNRLPLAELHAWLRESRMMRKRTTRSAQVFVQAEFQLERTARNGELKIEARIQPPQPVPAGSRVVGIDLTAGDKATGLALLDGCSVETSSLFTDDEIIEYVRKSKPKIVSIDSPLGLPGGGQEIDSKAGIVRVAEHDLASVGIPAYPALIDSMEKLTLRGIRLRRAIEALTRAPQVIESYPGAAQDILCIPRKQKSLGLLREGLMRLGLTGAGLNTHSHDEMDAITSAIVARYYESGHYEPMGIPSEAQLIVPKVHPLTFAQPPVICLAGKTGAGKSVVARYLSVFYGFQWIRTRNVIRDLLLEDSSAPLAKRLFKRRVDPTAITEMDLREFGALILDVHKQAPLRKQLMKTIRRSQTPVVVDSIRDVVDVERGSLGQRLMQIWFIDCSDSIIRGRLADTKKMGAHRITSLSPVDRTAPQIRREAERIIPNSGSLEELRWAVDDTLFSSLHLGCESPVTPAA